MRHFITLALLFVTYSVALGQFGPGVTITSQFAFPDEIMTADLDGDQAQDIVMRNAGALVWSRNLGQGSFGALDTLYASNWGFGWSPTAFDLADVNMDGAIDVVVLDRQDSLVVWLPNVNGTGVFGPAQLIADLHGHGNIGAFRCTNIMGNDFPEAIVNVEEFSKLKVFINEGGSFLSVDSIGGGWSGGPLTPFISIGDIDLNGAADMVIHHWSGHTYAMLNTGGAGSTWSDTSLFLNTGGGMVLGTAFVPQLIDIDADGDLDFADAGRDNTPIWAEGFAADSGGFHQFLARYIGPPVPYEHTGWVAYWGCGSTASALWSSGPDGDTLNWSLFDPQLDAFGPRLVWASEPRIRLIRSADLDGDGVQDLILAHSDSVVSWYPNQLPAVLEANVALTPFDTLCLFGDPYALDHAAPPGGTWIGSGVDNNLFTPFGTGSYSLTYHVVDPGSGCPLSAAQAITVLIEPTITVISGSFDDCDTTPLQLAGWPSGGSWSGTPSVNGFIDKSCGARPLSGEVYYNMEAVNGGFCQASTISFVFPACIPVNLGADIHVCEEDEGDVIVELFVPSSESFVELLGPFYNIEQFINNQVLGYFDPAVGPGAYMVIGHVMDPFACMGIDTLFIVVNPNPQPGLLSADLTFCSNQIEGAVEANMVGDFSAPINASNTAVGAFNPSQLGQGEHPFTFTVVDDNGCDGALEDTLHIADPPLVTLDMSPININGGPVLLEGGSPEDGTYTVNGVEASFLDPGSFQVGDIIEVVYYYTDPLSGCSGSASVLVDIVTGWADPGTMAAPRALPNPASGHCQVLFSGGSAGITLVDALGREARQWQPMQAPALLDLSGLPVGSYILKVEAPGRMDRIRLSIR